MNNSSRIVIVISPKIGDAIFCTPAISILRKNLPEATLNIIAPSPYSAQVFEKSSDINNIFIVPNKKIVEQKIGEIDYVIDLHDNDETRKYAKLFNKAKIFSSMRTINGMHQSETATEFICNLLNINKSSYDKNYRLFYDETHLKYAKELLLNFGATFQKDEILIGCQISTYKYALKKKRFFRKNIVSKKAWPFENFAQLSKIMCAENKNIKFILLGAKEEAHLIKFFKNSGNNVISVMGKTTVLQLRALMEYLHVFLTADTGPQHIATASDVPIVALFSNYNDPAATGPYPLKPRQIILRKDEVPKITLKEVSDALKSLISC